jgi:predicted phage gp36 major capsid-like protein
MSDDIYKPITETTPAASDPYYADASTNEAGRTLLAAVVGGVVSAAGYLVYTRLPDDQKEKLHGQVRQLVESRVNELRGRFNI